MRGHHGYRGRLPPGVFYPSGWALGWEKSVLDAISVWLKDHWNRLAEFADDKAIVAAGSAVLALFTIVLAAATVFLWRATRDLVRDAQDRGERQLRAYVSVLGGAMVHGTVDNHPGYSVQIELKNGGATPGYSFTTWLMPPEIRDLSEVPFRAPRPDDERTGKSIIPPATSARINGHYQWKPGELEAVRNRQKGVFVWGGADYDDAFGIPRMIIFRMVITGRENTSGGNGWTLAPHSLGYDAN
jgi:hypothetical protein